MQRGQATIEYVLLSTALLVATCLLARFATPVEDIGRALRAAVAPRPAHEPSAGQPAARRRTRPPRPRERSPRRCYCPLDRDAARIDAPP